METPTKPPVDPSNQNWILQYWRPVMAWQYSFICLFDFVLAPILTALFSTFTGIPYVPWRPLTLMEGGFYHMSMGAIIGVSAWTRGQEKIQKIRNGIYDPWDIVVDPNSEDIYRYAEASTQVPIDKPLMRPRTPKKDQ